MYSDTEIDIRKIYVVLCFKTQIKNLKDFYKEGNIYLAMLINPCSCALALYF